MATPASHVPQTPQVGRPAGAEASVTDPVIDPTAAAVDAAVRRARAAQRQIAHWPQQRIDDLVAAVAWQCYRDDNARHIARLSRRDTRLGDTEHLHAMQRRRVLGVLRDLHGVRTTGVVEELPELGLTRIAKPMGVIAVASPATAPGPGIVCNALPILKTRNAAVFTPNPRAHTTAREVVRLMREALEDADAPADLFQCLEVTGRAAGTALMRAADQVVAIGGPGTVRRAHESGTPALGAGVGNPTVLVDETADLTAAAEAIATGASYNNGTSCSSESNVFVHRSVADRFRAELVRLGAHLCDGPATARIRAALWPDGRTLDRELIGRPAAAIAEAAGVTDAGKAAVLVLDCPDPGPDDPILREKISPLLTLAVYDDFERAVGVVRDILDRCGRGHSCGIHTRRDDRVALLADRIPTCRVVVNQSTMTNTGGFATGVPFTTTLSGGTWAGTGGSGNITWRDFLNHTVVSRPIPEVLPDERLLFGRHWAEHGGLAAQPVPGESAAAGGAAPSGAGSGRDGSVARDGVPLVRDAPAGGRSASLQGGRTPGGDPVAGEALAIGEPEAVGRAAPHPGSPSRDGSVAGGEVPAVEPGTCLPGVPAPGRSPAGAQAGAPTAPHPAVPTPPAPGGPREEGSRHRV
ncbi:aldehyde dehydrogenase family protein [Streptomyces huiliensis]|uniref:aldehyde dehydrogenase family protein n=1 Tax=Streptomyces huiliensis TaxID=2876027 RepID=UPI001CBC6935|nr:aldehyde dehydrogenase family protein [Streptomyces huiliensis]MBZ4319204.1 aldehyde dehydrogenase family protein [Streptomyces huiliensis]